ncbi:hypothetical protein Droror1_Dr00006290 [Drosera rotundifolia]
MEFDHSHSHSHSPSSSSSPMSQLPSDFLISILLHLPTPSIISFSLTCKRHHSLALSNTLWESVCARDWGGYFHSLKSHLLAKGLKRVEWVEVYKGVVGVERVCCWRLSDGVEVEVGGGEDGGPHPRASHSLCWVGRRLVLFGGGCEGGRHLDDTWMTCVSGDISTVSKWHKSSSGFPSGRFGHTCVVIGDCLIVFGGINDRGVRLNDTWIGHVVQKEASDPMVSWRPLTVGCDLPPPRGAHAGCCINNEKMLIYGGIGLNGHRLGDTWMLDLSEDHRFGTWHEVMACPSPPARSGHTLTCIDETRAVLFGGRGLVYEVMNDVWLFDDSTGHLGWKQLLFDLKNVVGGTSIPRVGHSAVVVVGSRVLIYAGEDSDRHRKDDFWLLDVNSIETNGNPSSSASSMAPLKWRKIRIDGYKPNSRTHAHFMQHVQITLGDFSTCLVGWWMD